LVNGLQIIGTKVRGCYADWTTIFRKCTNVILYGLDIDVLGTDLYTDGIHFVGGSNITISDCIVTSVDDALAFTIETQY
jgi:Glycosyl hydrolases family 28.